MDLSALSLAELRDLQQQIPAELKRRESAEKANVLNEVRAFAKARGFAIEDLLGKEVKVKAAGGGGKVKVKYRHPQNAELEWTGRGRKPKWVEAWLAEGASMDALLV
ncbi:histidinol phosphate phosphatase [Azonexus hydrophilus]|uniref:Histidinol phosphate phosphatase n=1 Tax=Azonexus hydrophilus TaxID=418702 RepID=A0A1R1I7X8_9RHOO|nr:H-NS histone family protein [Azonexus hydrophilus]OMG54815.1 histidinol phosphate phosphatase [Azonexus hydrophilus]